VTKPISVGVALTFALVASPGAQAQVALDVAKMTCEQFAAYKVANPKFIAIWLNGYHHGTRADTVVDVQQLDADTKKMQDYCIQNPDVPLMQAVEAVFAPRN
jgi:acid stress chaperone HdeB